jgi:hypothetical protein
MKTNKVTFAKTSLVIMAMAFCLMNSYSQQTPVQSIAFEDYAEALDGDDTHLLFVEEWQNMIGQWLEKPLCINSGEADMLMEYKIISLFQLNKLKEYRNIYGDLLSVYELAFIEGWDIQTIRKVTPLVTPVSEGPERERSEFNYRSFYHSLIMKTSFNIYKSKGYKEQYSEENGTGSRYYNGPAARMALRYDFAFRKKIALGFRAEKDPGEPYLVMHDLAGLKVYGTDLMSGYIQANDVGPITSVILGNYRVNFGYGVNLSGGQSLIRSRSGIAGMAHRIRPQTSVSEYGFYRGAAVAAGKGKLMLSAFVSSQQLDGTSVEFDSLTGKATSFSSIGQSGLHRTLQELDQRKVISEKVAGGFLVYRTNWLKTGVIALYNRFSASIAASEDAYKKFDLNGRGNFTAGWSATAWLPGIQVFTEFSISKNKGLAHVSGLQLSPVAGTQFVLIHRHFSVNYQNWNGSGFVSGSRNSGESGFEVSLRIELAKKWLVELTSDISKNHWVSYSLDAPSVRREVRFSLEKNWASSRFLLFSGRYLNEDTKNEAAADRVCHPVKISQYKFRAELRLEAMDGIRLKSRIEYSVKDKARPGILIFQDIEFASDRFRSKLWLRMCFFDAVSYTNSIYAYENDVLYDFTSFLHYGKGLRGIIMLRTAPSTWMDLWLRISTVHYTNKNIGTGWDEVEGNRQFELEVQARISLSH